MRYYRDGEANPYRLVPYLLSVPFCLAASQADGDGLTERAAGAMTRAEEIFYAYR
jgi:hypothetical protein